MIECLLFGLSGEGARPVVAAGVVILRRTPVVWPAVIELADLGQRSLSKIYIGGPPLPSSKPYSVPFFDSFLIFLRIC